MLGEMGKAAGGDPEAAFFVSRSCGQNTRRGSIYMNDMTWVGGGDRPTAGDGAPGGAVAQAVGAPGSGLAKAVEERAGVREALERMIASEEAGERLDEVELASKILWAYVGAMELRWREIEQLNKEDVDQKALKEATDLAAAVRGATERLAAERGKVDKLRKDIAGAVGGGALDLDAARDEIGRRLACLRRAGTG